MTTINDLLKSRTNDALDEDLKQYRRVVDFTRKQLDLWNTTETLTNELNSNEEDELNKNILSFSSTLDDYVNKFEKGDTTISNITLLIYKYNLLSNVLKKIKLNTLPTETVNGIYTKLDDLMPKLEELMRVGDLYGLQDRDSIAMLFNEFNNHSYKQIPVSKVILTVEKFTDEVKSYNIYAKQILDKVELMRENIFYLSKSDQAEVNKIIVDEKELNQKLRINGMKTITDDEVAKLINNVAKLDELIKIIDERRALFTEFRNAFEKASKKYEELNALPADRLDNYVENRKRLKTVLNDLITFKKALDLIRTSIDYRNITAFQRKIGDINANLEVINNDIADAPVPVVAKVAPEVLGDAEDAEKFIENPAQAQAQAIAEGADLTPEEQYMLANAEKDNAEKTAKSLKLAEEPEPAPAQAKAPAAAAPIKYTQAEIDAEIAKQKKYTGPEYKKKYKLTKNDAMTKYGLTQTYYKS